MIPKHIVQTWKRRDLPPKMQDNVNGIRRMNPEYEYTFYDDNACRAYLLEHFGTPYVDAFNQLRFGAFKADLWRYARLYQEGGVYVDIDFRSMRSLDDIIHPEDTFVCVNDRMPSHIFQAFIAVVPKHPVLKTALDIVMHNIATHYMGVNFFDRTGPMVFNRAICRYLGLDDLAGLHAGLNGADIRLLQHKSPRNVFDEKNHLCFLTTYDGYEQDKDRECYHGPDWLKDNAKVVVPVPTPSPSATPLSDGAIAIIVVFPALYVLIVVCLLVNTLRLMSARKNNRSPSLLSATHTHTWPS